jgi:uncharacterized membrane-anchored protein
MQVRVRSAHPWLAWDSVPKASKLGLEVLDNFVDRLYISVSFHVRN